MFLTHPSPRLPLILVLCMALVMPHAATAQVELEDRAVNVAINAGVGGAITWARAALAGKPHARALARGAAGGALIAGGKQVVGSRGFGTAYLGRHIALVGMGLANSAVTDTFVYPIPIGPVTLSWTPAARRVRARLNAMETIVLVHYATAARTRLAWDATLELGVPVFSRWGDIDGEQSEGFESDRVIVLSTAETPITRAHETIHVMQDDEVVYMVGSPLEAAVLSRSGAGRALLRYAETGLPGFLLPFLYPSSQCDSPFEAEAHTLTEGGGWGSLYGCS